MRFLAIWGTPAGATVSLCGHVDTANQDGWTGFYVANSTAVADLTVTAPGYRPYQQFVDPLPPDTRDLSVGDTGQTSLNNIILPLMQRIVPLALRVEGGTFVDERGIRWIAKGASGFGLFDRWRRGEDVSAVLDEQTELGVNIQRVFVCGVTPFATLDPLSDPAIYEAIGPYLDRLAAAGMLAEVTNDYDVPLSTRQQIDHMHRVLAAIGERAALYQHVNQGQNNNCPDLSVIPRPRLPNGVCCSGSPLEDGPPIQPVWDYGVQCSRRDWKWAPATADLWVMKYDHPGKAFWCDEPIGAAETEQPGRRTTNAALLRATAITAAALGDGFCFHCDPWSFNQRLGPVTRQCAEAVFSGLAAV